MYLPFNAQRAAAFQLASPARRACFCPDAPTTARGGHWEGTGAFQLFSAGLWLSADLSGPAWLLAAARRNRGGKFPLAPWLRPANAGQASGSCPAAE